MERVIANAVAAAFQNITIEIKFKKTMDDNTTCEQPEDMPGENPFDMVADVLTKLQSIVQMIKT